MGEHEREECQSVAVDAPVATGVDKTRRKLTATGLGAPILMTLVSKPALAGNCLSNMMSGNLSDPDSGGRCSSGWSPGGWGNPGGTVGSYSTLGAWKAIGYNYGERSGDRPAGNPHGYVGGTTFDRDEQTDETFNDSPFLRPPGWDDGITMREVIREKANSIERTYLVAWLNAKLGQVDPGFTYVLTPEQVLGLIDGTIDLPPGYDDLKGFFHSTWD